MKKNKTIKKGTWLLIAYVGITLLGIVAYLYGDDGKSPLWQIYVVAGAAATLALAILAAFGYYEYIKQEDIVKIKFKPVGFDAEKTDQNGNIDTLLTVLRKNCTRSEIQGLLGMIFNDYHGRHRYDLNDFLTNDGNILEVINNAQTGKIDEVVIKITQEELKQFNIP